MYDFPDLSAKQQQVLRFIVQYISVNQTAPTVREICEACGLSSPATVQGHLDRLEKKGYIRRNPPRSRSIELLVDIGDPSEPEDLPPEFQEYPTAEVYQVPIIGRVAAGQPILAEQNIEDRFPISLQLLGSEPEKSFMLHVKGESMINAGILDGDLVLVKQQNTARNGEIVVALIDDSATVKRFFREKEFIRLQPENDYMAPIYVKDASILGKVTGVFRMLA